MFTAIREVPPKGRIIASLRSVVLCPWSFVLCPSLVLGCPWFLAPGPHSSREGDEGLRTKDDGRQGPRTTDAKDQGRPRTKDDQRARTDQGPRPKDQGPRTKDRGAPTSPPASDDKVASVWPTNRWRTSTLSFSKARKRDRSGSYPNTSSRSGDSRNRRCRTPSCSSDRRASTRASARSGRWPRCGRAGCATPTSRLRWS